jgi:hypothetical protein
MQSPSSRLAILPSAQKQRPLEFPNRLLPRQPRLSAGGKIIEICRLNKELNLSWWGRPMNGVSLPRHGKSSSEPGSVMI